MSGSGSAMSSERCMVPCSVVGYNPQGAIPPPPHKSMDNRHWAATRSARLLGLNRGLRTTRRPNRASESPTAIDMKNARGLQNPTALPNGARETKILDNGRPQRALNVSISRAADDVAKRRPGA